MILAGKTVEETSKSGSRTLMLVGGAEHCSCLSAALQWDKDGVIGKYEAQLLQANDH